MRIGLTGGGATADRIVGQANRAEADGFTSMWYPSAAGGGDPLAALALAGRATSTIELGTAVLVTYTCHPVLRPTAPTPPRRPSAPPGGSPSASALHTGSSSRTGWACPYDTPGRHTDEYVQILARAAARRAGELRGPGVPGRGGTAPAAPGRGGNPGPGRGTGPPAAAGGRRLHGRDDPVDGQRHRDRDSTSRRGSASPPLTRAGPRRGS